MSLYDKVTSDNQHNPSQDIGQDLEFWESMEDLGLGLGLFTKAHLEGENLEKVRDLIDSDQDANKNPIQ